MINPEFYFDTLYSFQDRILAICRQVESGFYLSGGTAASRGYLNHRFSDDLDFFTNDEPLFGLWVERIIQALNQSQDFTLLVTLKEERFCRMIVTQADVELKLEWINDVPAHVGKITDHPVLGKLDSAENILANKITALIDRREPKDLADIWGFCTRLDLSLSEAIKNAESKAAGIFPADLARLLCSATPQDWEVVRWIHPPEREIYLTQLYQLGDKLLLITD